MSVFYLASKLLLLLFQPSSLIALALGLGLALSLRPALRRAGLLLSFAGFSGLIVAGFLPLGNLLILPLEERFGTAQPAIPEAPVAGIIVLGGFEDGWVSKGRGGLAVNESAERLTEGLRLAQALPQAKVIVTGGVGELLAGADAEEAIRLYLTQTGIAPSRIVIEPKSRNTSENARFTFDLVRPKPDERWVLVTSAYHMPRAVGVFRHAGFKLVPYPVDFRTRSSADLLMPFKSVASGLQRTDLAFKEWIGLVAYRLTGRMDEWFPGPG